MLNEDKNQFQAEQSKLLKTILDLRFFQPWIDMTRDSGALNQDANLEIFLTAACLVTGWYLRAILIVLQGVPSTCL